MRFPAFPGWQWGSEVLSSVILQCPLFDFSTTLRESNYFTLLKQLRTEKKKDHTTLLTPPAPLSPKSVRHSGEKRGGKISCPPPGLNTASQPACETQEWKEE